MADFADDPFASARRERGVLRCPYGAEAIPLILRYRDVREAAKDVETFSSDAPQRVPIPSEEAVRSVRQLPIETDPPLHEAYRAIVQPRFRKPQTDPAMPDRIEAIVAETLAAANRAPQVDLVAEVALPIQSRALAVLLDLPDSEADMFVSWGTHVFRAGEGLDAGKGSVLDAYIDAALDRAEAAPGADFFSELNAASFKDRPLTREEKVGFANLAFAGGRDTVINVAVNAMAWLAEHPAELERLRADPALATTATEELVRFFAPLTHIGRVVTRNLDLHGEQVEAGARASLCWSSANRDDSVFEAPDELRLDRSPNPHVGFGSGRHTCLGAPHARLVIRALLRRLSESVARIELIEAVPALERHGALVRKVGYERLVARLVSRD